MYTRSRFFWNVGLAAAYLAAARLGFMAAFAAPQVTLVWPPTGLSLAALLLLGWDMWPGVFVGAWLASVTTHEPLAVACAIATGNTLEALVAARLLRRYVGDDNAVNWLRYALGLVALGRSPAPRGERDDRRREPVHVSHQVGRPRAQRKKASLIRRLARQCPGPRTSEYHAWSASSAPVPSGSCSRPARSEVTRPWPSRLCRPACSPRRTVSVNAPTSYGRRGGCYYFGLDASQTGTVPCALLRFHLRSGPPSRRRRRF